MAAPSLADFLKTKKKKVVKGTNLNRDVGTDAKKKDDDENGSPKNRVVADFTKPECENNRRWGAAPKTEANTDRYTTSVGAVSDYRYPELGCGLHNTNIQVGKITEKAPVTIRTNAFAALKDGDDSGDEENKTIKAAHVKKQKGANIAHNLETVVAQSTGYVAPVEEDPKAAKERAEKLRRKQDKACDAQKRKEEYQNKQEEERAARLLKKPTLDESPLFTCDFSKFSYVTFNGDLSFSKYVTEIKSEDPDDDTVTLKPLARRPYEPIPVC